jgi:hypothetical protein
MNCYIETHVGRVTEDPEAFCKIMDRCRVPFETNGDLSHYVYRGLRSEGAGAEDVSRILSVMGHTHQRMARDFGDLSAVVEDPAQDWEDGGMTFRAFEFSKPVSSQRANASCIQSHSRVGSQLSVKSVTA